MNVEVERALADLTEVRDRLASVQRFRGYSSRIAAASGAIAFVGGVAQWYLVPHPSDAADIQVYLTIWLSCLAGSLFLYYTNILAWRARNRSLHAGYQTRTVSLSILPAIGLGAVLSLAAYLQNVPAMLPGIWYSCYGLGLFASRTMIPKGVQYVAAMFGLAGTALLLMPNPWLGLTWWVMPLGFFVGQFWIARFIAVETETESELS